MSELPLYRDAALQSSRFRWHGDVLIVSPLPARIASLISAALVLLICLYFVFGSYTKRVTVPGQVMPKAGVVRVYVQQPGVVVEERVVEGQHVGNGDVLFLISNDLTSSVGEVQAAISGQVERQRTSLIKQLAASKELFEEQQESLAAKILVAKESTTKLEAMILTQRERVILSQQNLQRYEQLQQFGTHDQLVARQTDLLEQRTRLEGLEREKITLRGNLEDLQAELTALPIQYEREIANLEANLAGIDQRYAESESKRQYAVVATEAGIVTAITARKGQRADSSAPIASIIPEHSELQAELFAPSRAVGFAKPGDAVFIRYQAFPYQKFGQQAGSVASIATNALSSAELTRTNVFSMGATPGGEPLYRIVVDLESQQVRGEAESYSLRAGMLLEADVMQEERRLYEWILEPLYRLRERT